MSRANRSATAMLLEELFEVWQREVEAEAPSADECASRRARSAPGNAARPGERARLQALRGPARRRAAGARQARAATKATYQAPRRQGLRLPSLPTSLPRPRHRFENRATRCRVERAAGTVPLGRGEDPGLASSIPPCCRPIRAPTRHPPRLNPPRLRAHLVQVRGEVLQSRLTVSTSSASHAFHGRRGVNAAATAAGLDPSSSVVPRPA